MVAGCPNCGEYKDFEHWNKKNEDWFLNARLPDDSYGCDFRCPSCDDIVNSDDMGF